MNNINLYELSAAERAAKGIRELPGFLGEALDELESDTVLREALGEPLFQAFMRAKRAEVEKYRMSVTDWEVQRYLETA